MSKIKGKIWVASTYVMAYDMVIQKFWTTPVGLMNFMPKKIADGTVAQLR